MRLRIIIVLVIGALVLALSRYMDSLVQVETTEPVPPNEAALADRFLALARWLELEGVPVRRASGLGHLGTVTTGEWVLLPAPRGRVSRAQQDQLLALLRRGQHVLIESEAITTDDPLLESLGVRRRWAESLEFNAMTGWRERSDSQPFKGDELVRYRHAGARLQIWQRGEDYFSLPKERRSDLVWQVRDGEGARALQFRHEGGLVTVINDASLWHNNLLGRHHNAEFFWQLWLQTEPRSGILIIDQQPGLWAWLQLHAWRVLWLVPVWLAMWLWYVMPRFGPIRPEPLPQRRQLLDHLHAAGRLLWSSGARMVLAQSAREAALRRLAERYPHTALLDAERLRDFLRQRLGLNALHADRLVGSAPLRDGSAFLGLIRACVQIHRLLQQHGQVRTPLLSVDLRETSDD